MILKKKIFVFLFMKPENGGKYQYTLAMLDGLSVLYNEKFTLYAVYYDKKWESVLSKSFIRVCINKRNKILKVAREVLITFPVCGLFVWSKISKKLDPLFKTLDKYKPDLLIFPGGESLLYESDIPSIIPVFDLMHRYETGFPEVSEKYIYRKREKRYKRISEYAKGILVDSEVGKKQMIESYGTHPDKIFVLPYIAPSYVYILKPIDVRQKYRLPDKFIFYPAQFWSHKNHKNLLKSIRLLKDKDIKINAVFVGSEKNAHSEIFKLIQELKIQDEVYVLKYVNNQHLISLYKSAVALVMPTFFGPTNIPQLEAFALGCPVLTSKVYGIPEQVGKAALLFNPHNVNEIADNIYKVWTDETIREELIIEGYRLNKHYSLSNYSALLLNYIKQIVKDDK
jgi:glycosyltransferase involved in cell wall biosynthesis